ncbi:helix-turn-helix domain-containing protein, partial [Bacillus thuringiensis]|nr:helix-turn-helix domain-containing protein [Bacillus thuringiensis]
MEVTYSVIDRWIKKYENEGILGLQEKRGRSKQTNEVSQDARIQRLEAENAYLKKLLATKKTNYEKS